MVKALAVWRRAWFECPLFLDPFADVGGYLLHPDVVRGSEAGH